VCAADELTDEENEEGGAPDAGQGAGDNDEVEVAEHMTLPLWKVEEPTESPLKLLQVSVPKYSALIVRSIPLQCGWH
jgi:hypothetical protein